MKRKFRKSLTIVTFVSGLVALMWFCPTWAAEQNDFPNQGMDYIIPFSPGGESDQAARMQVPFFQKVTGQSLTISYMKGGGGAVAWSQLNNFDPDGYTIMGVNLPHIIVKPMLGDVGFQTSDLGVFYIFQYTPNAIVVRKDSRFKTLKDLIDYAKANPGRVTFSGTGLGTANSIANATFQEQAGVKTTYIPFSGTGTAFPAMLGGHVMAEWGYTTVAATHPDKTRLLAVAMDHRHPLFPDVPTFKELGIDMLGGTYRGMAAPKDTPKAIKQKLSDIFAKINHDPEFKEKMTQRGFVIVDVSLDEMSDFLAKKRKQYTSSLKQMDLLK